MVAEREGLGKMAKSPFIGPFEPETGRHLVFLDIENTVGGPRPTAAEVSHAHFELLKVVPDIDAVQVIVACSHLAAAAVAFEFPGALRLWRSGPDGADLALINQMGDLRVMRRFERVTLCSGDGIFAESLAALAAAGIKTTVVSAADRLSRRLRLAAQQVVTLYGVPNQEVA
jgi:hypothetical protein